MKTKRYFHPLLVLALVALLTFGLATPALAFDPIGDDTITIEAGEVIEDDLYLFGNLVTINGTVKGDVVAFGSSITLNGLIEGDFIAAGRDVTINGEVTDDLRMAGYALKLGPEAKIGDDALAAGFSLEANQGSTIGGALVVGAFQAVIDSQVAQKAYLGLDRLEFNGHFMGDAEIGVGDPEETSVMPVNMYGMGSDMPPVPSVKPGLNFGPEAQIDGKLEYTSQSQYTIPAGVVAGAVTYTTPPVSPQDVPQYRPLQETNPVLYAVLEALRFLVTLSLIGLLLALLVPAWINRPAAVLQQRPLHSLGSGLLAFVAVGFTLSLLGVVVIALAVLFGALTLDSLTGLTLMVGGSAFSALLLSFGLVCSYLSYLVVAYLGGRWILNRFNPALVEKPYWAVLLGVFILAVLTAIPFLGGLVRFLVVLTGVGAVAILLWERFRPAPAAPALVPAE
ncbi:MAG: hypothetical protein AB1894_13840 [Chloroflexota bacterium]